MFLTGKEKATGIRIMRNLTKFASLWSILVVVEVQCNSNVTERGKRLLFHKFCRCSVLD